MSQSLHWTAGVHHDGSSLYVSNPKPKLGETVEVRLRVPINAPLRIAVLRTVPDGEPRHTPMTERARDTTSVWFGAELKVSMPLNPYRFRLLAEDGAWNLTARGIGRADWPDWPDFKLVADFQAPDWIDDAVFYQIFPDRFFNGDPALNVKPGEWTKRQFATQLRPWGAPPMHHREAGNLDFYGGDLPGIAKKLDYLADLGANALYINPIFSARTNHRYDVMDFFNIDPHVGGNDGLADLRKALDTAGMHVILDITLNHCGSEHPWFKAAQADASNPTSEFFTFTKHPDEYESWLGVRSLVKLNYRSQKLRDVLYRSADSALRVWLRAPYRIDGWRLDVANMQARQGAHQLGNEVGREMRRAVKAENPNAYLLGEDFHDGTPHLQGDELDATMNYSGFTFALWRWLTGHELGVEWGRPGTDSNLLPAETMIEQWTAYRAAVPWVIARQQFNLLCSHDTMRILNVCTGNKRLAKLAAVFLMTYPGVPSVYYGDEIGLPGGTDPENRVCMPWDEDAWDQDMRAHYRNLIHLRRTAPALIQGGYQDLVAREGLVVYQRQSAKQRLIVVGYRGPDTTDLTIPVWHAGVADGTRFVNLLDGKTASWTTQNGALHLSHIEPGTGLILEAQA